MKSLYKAHREKVHYLLIGAWNTIFGYLSFVVLYYMLARTVSYLVIFVVSNVLSITNAYIGYKAFVFRTKGNYLKEYLRFYAVYGASALLNLALLFLTVELFKMSPVAGQAIAMSLTVVVSYLGHKKISFAN